MPTQLQLRLSDVAFEGLVKQGRDNGYIRGKNNLGLTFFMHDLLRLNPTANLWHDYRPQSVRQFDLEILEAGHLPPWDTEDARYPRCLGFNHSDQDTTESLANQLGLARERLGTRAFARNAVISQFWEVVGLRWLRPTTIPSHPYKKAFRHGRKEDFNW